MQMKHYFNVEIYTNTFRLHNEQIETGVKKYKVKKKKYKVKKYKVKKNDNI